MDIEEVKKCSYNELKQIALDQGIFKSIKSKKKAVLLEKIINHLSQSEEESSDVNSDNKENSPAEVLVPVGTSRQGRGRKAKANSSRNLEETSTFSSSNRPDVVGALEEDNEGKENILESDVLPRKGRKRKAKVNSSPAKSTKLTEKQFLPTSGTSNLTETSVMESAKDCLTEVAVLSSEKAKKGKKTRSKKLMTEDIVKAEGISDLSKSPIVESARGCLTEVAVLSSDKPKKGKKTRSKNLKTEDIVKTEEHLGISDLSKTPIVESAKGCLTEVAVLSSDKPKKGKKTRSKNLKTEDIVKTEEHLGAAEKTETLVVESAQDHEELEEPVKHSNEKPKKGKNTRSKDRKPDLQIEKTTNLPEGLILASDRKGTFTVSSHESSRSRTTRISNIPGTSNLTETCALESAKDCLIEVAVLSSEKTKKGKKARSKNLMTEDIVKAKVLPEKTKTCSLEPMEEGPRNSSEKKKRGIKESKDLKADLSKEKAANLPDGLIDSIDRRGTFSICKNENSKSRATRQCSTPIDDSDRRGTFVKKAAKNPVVIGSDDAAEKPKIGNRTRSKDLKTVSDKKESAILPGGYVPVADRRGTFSVSTPKAAASPANNRSARHPSTLTNLSIPSLKRSFSETKELQLSSDKPTSTTKENRGSTFSAKKMPLFAKIHKKNFERMESLHSYSARKLARRDIFSLNKSFGGLVRKENKIKSMSNTEHKPSKTLIPVRATHIHLDDKEKITAFANKTRLTKVETIREKDREIIKGVRANKRFMLQMKMRKIDI